jgi:hypothetical protein
MRRPSIGSSIWLLLLAACGGDARKTTPLASDGTHLRDAQGRIALLRGINARVAGTRSGMRACASARTST